MQMKRLLIACALLLSMLCVAGCLYENHPALKPDPETLAGRYTLAGYISLEGEYTKAPTSPKIRITVSVPTKSERCDLIYVVEGERTRYSLYFNGFKSDAGKSSYYYLDDASIIVAFTLPNEGHTGKPEMLVYVEPESGDDYWLYFTKG